MFKRDPVVLAVNDLISKSKKALKNVKKVVLTYLGYSVEDISEIINGFERMSRDETVISSMEKRAEKKFGELGKKVIDLSILNTRVMLKIREIAEKERLKSVKDREQALEVITKVFGSPANYIKLLEETVAVEEILSKRKKPPLRFISCYIVKRYRKKLEMLKRELLKSF